VGIVSERSVATSDSPVVPAQGSHLCVGETVRLVQAGSEPRLCVGAGHLCSGPSSDEEATDRAGLGVCEYYAEARSIGSEAARLLFLAVRVSWRDAG